MRFLLTLCCTSKINHVVTHTHKSNRQQIYINLIDFKSRGERPNNVYTRGTHHNNKTSFRWFYLWHFTSAMCDMSIRPIDIFMYKMRWFCLQFHIKMGKNAYAVELWEYCCWDSIVVVETNMGSLYGVTVNGIFQGLLHKDSKIKPNN